LILLLAFVAIGLLNYNASRSALRYNIIHEALPGISNEIYHEIQRDLITPIQVSSLMANDTFLKDWVLKGEQDIARITKYLWEIKEKYGFFSTFLISSQTGNYYHFKGLHKKISPEDPHDVWYYRFIASGKDYDLDVDTDEAAQDALTIFINHRLNDYQGNLIGVTGVGLNMGKMGRLLHSYEERYRKNIYLVSKKGVIQIHTDRKLIEKRDIHHLEGIQNIAQDLLVEDRSKVIREYDRQDRQIIVLSRYVPEFDWFLIVEHEQGEAMREIKNVFVRNLTIGLVVTVLVIVIIVFVVNYYQSRLEKLATTDELTGLPNRRFFINQAKRDLANSARWGRPFSLLMIDIDHFKRINDTAGHEAGDLALKAIAELFRHTLRSGDLVGRLGGEEFAALLPQTDSDQAREVAERLRRFVEASASIAQGVNGVTVSVGLTTRVSVRDEGELEMVMKEADRALYRAKELGRNRVCIADNKDEANHGSGNHQEMKT
ncbi:MAG: sensor domain-containing diguanylate cyclase, partial [Thermodesulfobacteriota bacterium]